MTRKKERQSLTLELEIDGEIKRFVTPQRIPGVLLREAGLIADEFETGVADIADLDSYYQFICDAFGNQFSITEIEFGLDSRDVMKTIYAVALTVIGQVSLATEMLLQDVDLANFIEKKTTIEKT